MNRPGQTEDELLVASALRIWKDVPVSGDGARLFGWIERELHRCRVENDVRGQENRGTEAQALAAILRVRDDGLASVKTHSMPAPA